MTPAKIRQAVWKARLKEKGLRKMTVVVPIGDEPKIRAMAMDLIKQNSRPPPSAKVEEPVP